MLVERFIKKVKNEELALKRIKFNGQLMEFRKADNKNNCKNILGSLISNQLIFYTVNIVKIKLAKILKNFRDGLHLFRNENG